MNAFLDEVEAAVPALRRYARALTRNADRADDLVQDCLERAIRKQRLFRPTGPVEAWLFRMLLNLFRNQRRSERRQAPAVTLDAIPFEPVSPPAQPGRIALAEMSRAIDALPDDQRETLLLVALEGFSYAEVAGILQVPEGTVMSRLSRARAALRRLVGPGDEPHLRAVK